MRVTIVGGGPGGLYTALLLKRSDPSHQVTVVERNAPDDTFGFGVVFSAATLHELEEADATSYRDLVRAAVRWDPVEIVYGGQRVRGHGNRFAAVSRHTLLELLQRRCRDLEVDLRFRTEVDDPLALAEDADLLVGADGVNSRTRSAAAAAFRPRLRIEGSTFVWLGTTKVFDVFTFIFEDTEWGPFQAHIYPYRDPLPRPTAIATGTAAASTFIVECDREVWAAAGLDAVDPTSLPPGVSDEHSLKFLQELFAEHLDGHDLIGNNSKWLDWVTVRVGAWHHGNVALLGDAAHTAHFSIGSGTKLAMEDAVALVRALEHAPTTEVALAEYEAERRPLVERTQEAASRSLDWFARYRRYWGFAPPRFAYSLLTRSARLDYDSVRRRDPQLVLGVERWLAEEARGAGHDVPVQVPPPPALNPVTVGPRRLGNRAVLVVPAEQGAVEGVVSAAHAADVTAAARGGAGLALVPLVAVAARARVTPADAGLYDDRHEQRWREVLGAARERGGASLGVQLVHAGRRGSTRPRAEGIDRPLRRGAWRTVAPSALPYTSVSPPPRALDREGMVDVRDAFAAAARRAAAAGFDLLELHAGHGYLLASYLSPLTNRRDDAYGGDLDGRARFPLEVLDAVRAVWPADRPLSVCLSASDLESGGLAEAEAIEVARRLHARGADLLHVVAGQTTPSAAPEYQGAYDAPWSDLVRNEAGVPTLGGGDVPTLAEANHVVAAGWADLVVVGHPPPVEPAWLAAQRI